MAEQSLDRLAAVFLDHAPEAVNWLRRDGSIAYVNHAAAEMLGVTRERLLEMSIFDIDPEVDSEFWSHHWSDAARRERVKLERNHRHRDGTLIPVEVRIRNLFLDGERYHFSFVRDLRAQRQARDLAERHEQLFEAVFLDAPLPQFIIEPEEMRIVEANRAAKAFYGYGDQLVGMTIPDINPMPAETIRSMIDRAHQSGRQCYSVHYKLASGELRAMTVYTGRIRYQGRWLVHATNQDVTELDRARRRLVGFRDLVQRLPVGIFRTETGPEGRILEANPMLAEILEYDSPDDLIGRNAAGFYPERAQRLEFSRRIEHDGEARSLEHQLVTRSGRRIWVSLTARRVIEPDGSVVIEGAMEDMTARKRAELERSAFARMFQSAIELAPLPIMLYRVSGRIEQVNDVWCESTGYSREQLTSIARWTALAYQDDADRVRKRIQSLAELQGRKAEGDYRILCADGSTRIWSFHTIALEPADNPDRLLMSTAVDVTEERRRQHQALLAQSIIQTASEGITVTDADRNIVQVNPAFTRITGYPLDEVIGRNPRILSSGRQSRAFYDEMWNAIERDGHWQGEIWNRRKSGEIYPEWLSISEIRGFDGTITNYAAIFTDLTELKQSQSSLEQLRKFDPLTGLFNQESFRERLQQWLELRDQSEQIAVLLLGLDRFRRINEGYTHEFGDRILIEVARRLDQSRTSGMLIGRAGSDRFVIAVTAADSDLAIRNMLRTIERSIALPVDSGETDSVPISFSTGIARYPADGDSASVLLRNAESAMFDAKRRSPGSYRFFDAERTRRSRRTLWLEHELRHAIETGELEAHLQPILTVADQRVVGAEALARWTHPEHGPISPGEFIPVAEESGLITAMSLTLLARIAPLVAKIRLPGFMLAFNISAVQFRDPGFVAQLLEVIDYSGIDRRQFELELTESTMMEQAGNSTEMLGQLRSHGIRLSIDDFGTGFSSLAYLQEIRANTLKIDRRFIAELHRDPASERIVDSIIAMAHALDMKVVAEGVEQQQQLRKLRQLGCDFYQGFLFSPALAAEQFIERFCVTAAANTA